MDGNVDPQELLEADFGEDPSIVEYTTTNKGFKRALLDGYSYVRQKRLQIGDNAYRWICSDRREFQCKGSISIEDDTEVVKSTPHSHTPDPSRLNVHKVGILRLSRICELRCFIHVPRPRAKII